MPSFDDIPTLCSPTLPVSAPRSREMPSFDDIPVLSDKKVGPPVPLLGDPKKKCVRLSESQNYVDPSKFNPTYLQHMAHSIPIDKCRTKDSPTFENSDVLNTTVSSACNYVKPKKKRGERLTKNAVSGSSAVLFALKHKVQSLQLYLFVTNY